MSDSSNPQSLSPPEATRRRVGLALLLLFAGACGSSDAGGADASGAPTPAPPQPSPGTPAPQPLPPSAPPPAGRAAFPPRREGAKRHLVDANGGAFLLQGDTPWSLFVAATREQVDQYLDD